MTKAGTFGADGMSADDAVAAFSRAGVAIVLTNPSLPDNPIVYVNDAFERVTGYSRGSALGRNCRFLQGPATDPDHVIALRDAIAAGEEVSVDIVNYKATGERFVNRLLVSPVRDRSGRISHFLGIQKALSPEEARRSSSEAAHQALREIHHRVKNHLAMIVGLIRLQAKGGAAEPAPEVVAAGYDVLARRVESLQLLYEELSHAGAHRHGGRIALGAYLSRVASAVAHLDGRPGIRVAIDMAPLHAEVDTAARIGLVLSEVVTNAMEHAYDGRDTGSLAVGLAALDGGGAALRIQDDGTGLPDGVLWPDMGSLGGRIVAGLVEGVGGRLLVESGPGGTTVTLSLPADSLLA